MILPKIYNRPGGGWIKRSLFVFLSKWKFYVALLKVGKKENRVLKLIDAKIGLIIKNGTRSSLPGSAVKFLHAEMRQLPMLYRKQIRIFITMII